MRTDQERVKAVGVISEDDKRVVVTIKRITARGNHAEVKRKADGSLTVYEVKKRVMQ